MDLNPENKPIEIETLRKNAWSKALKSAGIEYRPIIQARHTFAAMIVSAGRCLLRHVCHQSILIRLQTSDARPLVTYPEHDA